MSRWGESPTVSKTEFPLEPSRRASLLDAQPPLSDDSATSRWADGRLLADDSIASSVHGNTVSYMDLGPSVSTKSDSFGVSTPSDRFSDSTSLGLWTQPATHLKDRPPVCPLALKDRSNHKTTPYDKDSTKHTAEKRSTAKAGGSKRLLPPSSTPLARFSLADEPLNNEYPASVLATSKTPSMSAKRRKKTDSSGSDEPYESRKGRPVLAVAAASGVQLVRSSAQLLGSTLQSAFTSNMKTNSSTKQQNSHASKSPYTKTPATSKKRRGPRDSMTPQKGMLPTFEQVDSIRNLVRAYTLLDPRDRQNSVESLLIQKMTGYTLNPPLVSLVRSAPARSPIQTRSGKLETLLSLNIDLIEMDACKNRDQQLAEACTQCRYDRDGYKFRFSHIPSGKLLSAEQYEARYLVMLDQLCKSRSDFWSEYFAKLYGTAASPAGSRLLEQQADDDRDDVVNGDSSTRVLIDRNESDCWAESQASDRVPAIQDGRDVEPIVVLDETKSVVDAKVSLAPVYAGETCIVASSLGTGQLVFSAESCDVGDESLTDGPDLDE